MKNFMDENFLLQTETAQKLYHEHAAKMPIIDYHCHLIPRMVADDYKFKSLTDIWLGGDHYKWRAMRTNGVDERFCTGKATDWEKFEKWAETVPYTFRNPLYHWTHLELKTAFGSEIHHVIEAILSKQTVYYFAAANISLDKKAAFIVDILGNGSQISCIRQSIQYHDFDVVMFG